MAKKKTMKWLAMGALVLGVALMGGTAWATNMFAPGATCTTLNCGARLIQGTVTQLSGNAQPWVAEVFAPAGRCLRVAVTAQEADLETVVRAPDGALFRNDDGFVSPCGNCPVVKIASTPNNGWYTVSVSHFFGSPVNANFSMRFNNYPVGNINCANPTIPVATDSEKSTKPQTPQIELNQNEELQGGPGPELR